MVNLGLLLSEESQTKKVGKECGRKISPNRTKILGLWFCFASKCDEWISPLTVRVLLPYILQMTPL